MNELPRQEKSHTMSIDLCRVIFRLVQYVHLVFTLHEHLQPGIETSQKGKEEERIRAGHTICALTPLSPTTTNVPAFCAIVWPS
jgi:hypothetical protein